MIEFKVLSLDPDYDYVSLINTLTEEFGKMGDNWFIYNGKLYIKDNETYTWFILKYG